MSSLTVVLLGVIALIVGAVLFWRAIELVNRRPEWGAFALFLWLGALVYGQDNPEIYQVSLGGINVTLPDVLCGFLAVIAALRFLRGIPQISRNLAWPLLILGGALLLSYVRGLAGFGLQHATNEFREFFYFLTALTYAMSFPFERLGEKLPLLGVLGGTLLMIIAALRLSTVHVLDIDHRPLPSYGALAVGEAFFLGWFWLRTIRRPQIWQWLVLFFLPFTFFMLHRSVWMCLLAGMAAMLLFDPPGRKRLISLLIFGTALATIIVALFLREKVEAGLDNAVTETTKEDSTFAWRVQGWTALLTQDGSVPGVDLAVGRPMGSGYARRLGDSVLDTQEIDAGVIPHNYYVSMLLRGGLIGLAAFVLLYARLIRNVFRVRREDPADPYPSCFLVILFVQLVYYVPYSADYIQGLLLGGAIALVSTPRLVEASTLAVPLAA